MGVLSKDFEEVVRYVKRAAQEQGGIISGANPTTWNMNDPFPLWVIQVFIIVCFTQLLALLLAKVRQPRVIAEVIGGILLGPTVMGRIPHFSNRIFPTQSLSILALTSTIGLVLFLFLIGLEIDVRVLKRNAKYSLTISATGMILPFALGVGLAVALYNQFVESNVNFGHFLLFVGVAVAITAFPVLCRILTDLDLLNDHVGIIVLSAGVGNDVVGWILLALAVALTNASSGLTALWILMAGTAFVLFMLFPVRWAFVWLGRHTGSLENGSPTPFMMTVTLLVILVSAFFTDVIGIHPIFGGFIAGLIVPHEGGFAIALVEKLEDLVTIIFLPIYFTLSGLRTNLGLLNDGISWGYIVLICTIAFFGKFIGCAVAAKFMGFSIRESGAIGTLMSCKGLVELIVLNVGLQAGILDTRIFSMFVVHAVVLTVMTTPLTLWFYPKAYRTGLRGKRGSGAAREESDLSGAMDEQFKTRFSVVLNRIEHLPAIMTITQLLKPLSKTVLSPEHGSVTSDKDEKGELSRDITQEKQAFEYSSASTSHEITKPPVSIEALRLIELTDRTSAVMRSSEADDLIQRDALVSIFSTFGRLNRIPVSTSLSIVSQDAFSTSVATHARDTNSQLIVVPWHSGTLNVFSGEQGAPSDTAGGSPYNPLEGIFGKGSSPDKTSSVVYSNFVRKVFSESPTDVALFVDRGDATPSDQHIFFPFFGGPDDRLALRFVVQLCANPNITATIVRMKTASGADLEATESTKSEVAEKAREAINSLTVQSATGFPDTIYVTPNTETRMASDTADNILWSRFAHLDRASTVQVSPQAQAALCRVAFSEMSSPTPLQTVIQRAAVEAKTAAEAWKSLLLVVGRGRRLAVESHREELNKLVAAQAHSSISEDVPRTIGEVGAGFVAATTNISGMLVMQSAPASSF